ncbi:MAG: VPLPA-CTERM sorting domain-containing protein [Parvularculaceae bacterium]|nr:VPLPA-CTERM sorting domain-containing protein [Parvularculaceae bacterium]
MFASEASAGTVSYNTNTSQLCIGAAGCGVATQTIGGSSGVTITYIAESAGLVDANPTSFAGLGRIEVSCVGGGTTCGEQSLAGLNLYINVTQSGPSAGVGLLPALSFSGSIGGASSSALGTTSLTTALIGAVTYRYFSGNVFLNPPATSNGRVFLTGVITDSTPEVPVPAALPLLLSGLAGLRLASRKKKAA